MTRYHIFDQLAELTKLTKTDNGYSKFIQTGDIEFYDYNRGYFDVDVYTNYSPMDKKWYVRIWVGSVDDGDYGGWLEASSKEEADTVVERIATEVLKDMVVFPTLAEFNKILMQYGILVDYE